MVALALLKDALVIEQPDGYAVAVGVRIPSFRQSELGGSQLRETAVEIKSDNAVKSNTIDEQVALTAVVCRRYTLN